jgi:hypothetical protein
MHDTELSSFSGFSEPQFRFETRKSSVMPPKFTKDDKEQMSYIRSLGPPGRILWLDDLPDQFEAQDPPEEESPLTRVIPSACASSDFRAHPA